MKSVLELPRTSKFLLPGRTIDRFSRAALFSKLKTIQFGRMEVIDEQGTHFFGDPTAAPRDCAQIVIHHHRAYSRIALGGSVGSGESFIDGDWDCVDLVNLIRIFVRNREQLNQLDSGIGAFFAPLQKILHTLRGNGIQQARKNIKAHYDLGNDFFSLFLDETWMYSSGVFRTPDASLYEAQVEKNDRLCRKLRLKPSDHLLEIGTGWGGFAIHAAKNYGCRVTTTTISDEQFRHASARIAGAGLGGRITLLKEDYRKLTGQFDKLVSIEMIEAVGLDFLDTYFEKCSSLLKPEGCMALQSILIQDQYFEQAARSVDFIQTHVFPGAAIPAVGRIMKSIEKYTDMKLWNLEDFGPHYAKTLNHWAKRLEARKDEIGRMGYPDYLYRLWKYYFAYCEGGFEERAISLGQFLFTKPSYREEALLVDSHPVRVKTVSAEIKETV